ncbi:MAG: hypothetical protein IJP35_03390 [Clostridia bacterium]|nr:hypothetical protein [Clostridia bacterium]
MDQKQPTALTLPSYVYETLREYDKGDAPALLFALLAYWYEGIKPNLAGWDACLFDLMVDDLQARHQLAVQGGAEMAKLMFS